MNDEIYLTYTGAGFLYGVPARSLTREEAEIHGEKRLIDSGLYKYSETVKEEIKTTKRTRKALRDATPKESE